MLNDDDVFRKLRLALYPQALANKIDTLTQTIAELNMKLKTKKSRIATLEEKVDSFESECDNIEQYSCRWNLR